MSNMTALVEDFLSQKRIAIVGVSREANGSAGNAIYKRFKDRGYTVYPVNPNAETIEGDRCYPDVKSIPEKVDAAVITTRPEVTEKVVQQCAEAGISRVWMHGSFMHGGSSVSDTAVKFCEDHHIAVISRGCPMMFGQTADGGHKVIKFVSNLFGGLPK